MNTKIPGKIGEAVAFNYLKQNDYKILETNYTCKMGEIDIIAKKDEIIVFVEVKARTTAKFGLPREAVTLYKQHKIKLVATYYLQKTKNFDKICRFDVIEILGENINHIQNAFL